MMACFATRMVSHPRPNVPDGFYSGVPVDVGSRSIKDRWPRSRACNANYFDPKANTGFASVDSGTDRFRSGSTVDRTDACQVQWKATAIAFFIF